MGVCTHTLKWSLFAWHWLAYKDGLQCRARRAQA